MKIGNHLVLGLLFSILALGGAAGEPGDGAAGAETPAPGGEELEQRIRDLIAQLGHDEYLEREGASSALLEIGEPARKLLEAAVKNPDPEVAARAAELLRKLGKKSDPSKVDPKATNGWMAVQGDDRQVQTFTAPADLEVEVVRFRAARGRPVPSTLTVELREAGAAAEAKPLASADLPYEWTSKAGNVTGVTRTFAWMTLPAKAKLAKGKTYEIVFASPQSGEANPWLINCLYRDVFKAGRHLRRRKGKSKKLGGYDLVFELRAKGDEEDEAGGKLLLTSVPKGTDLSKREATGLGHDGASVDKAEARSGVQGGVQVIIQ
jgi:hypothetical protein